MKIDKIVLYIVNVGDKMGKEYYCPECNSKLEKIEGCGSISYFCKKCSRLISKKRILDEEEKK